MPRSFCQLHLSCSWFLEMNVKNRLNGIHRFLHVPSFFPNQRSDMFFSRLVFSNAQYRRKADPNVGGGENGGWKYYPTRMFAASI